MTGPTIGLFSVNAHVCADPAVSARIGVLAEELGYDSLWAGEHVVLPSPRVAPSPMEPGEPILDPLLSLTHLAAHTSRVKLGTGVIVLPQRNPLVLAKQLASLDVLSGGRLIFGLGVGYLEPELTAIGVPMAGRAGRAMEYLAAMRSLWEDEAPAYQGRTVHFGGVDAHPRPVQVRLPIVMGGHSPAAHQRAARHADGWYGFMLKVDEAARQVEAVRRLNEKLHVSVTPGHRLTPEVVARYAELGVQRLIVMPRPNLSEVELVEFVRANAPDELGAEWSS